MNPTWINLDDKLKFTDKNKSVADVLSLPQDDWFWVKFHGAWMCSIYNCREDGGWLSTKGFNPNLPRNSTLIDNIKNIIFPFMGSEGNVTIIKTEPGDTMREHIDSALNEVGSIQYKFRWVLSGATDTLYFIDKHYNKHFISKSECYVINGGHPHGMSNTGSEIKLTLCVGSPWKANDVFLQNIKNIQWNKLSLPTIKEEWTDPRIEKNNSNVLGNTYFKEKI